MSGASDVLDPVEVAQDDISRSKRVIASALDDLSQHHSWLESYHREERRRAQRLRRQETLQALELRRQRAAWRLRRFALTSFVAMRTFAAFLARNSAAFLAWASPRAKTLALRLAKEASAAGSWSWRAGCDLTRRGFGGAVIGFAWTVHTSDVLGVAFRKRVSANAALLYAAATARAQPVLHPAVRRASAGWTRTRLRSKRLASTLQAHVSEGWSQTRTRAPVLARNAVAAMSQDCARLAEKSVAVNAQARDRLALASEWTRARAQHVARAGLKTVAEAWAQAASHMGSLMERRTSPHRALIVRQSSALVCFEPRRARLPVVRGS